MCFNNSPNVFIEKFSNEICYRFKIRKAIYVVVIISINKNVDKNVKAQLDNLEATRFRYR